MNGCVIKGHKLHDSILLIKGRNITFIKKRSVQFTDFYGSLIIVTQCFMGFSQCYTVF